MESFLTAAGARKAYLTCPGLRGENYTHLYGCGFFGVLHPQDFDAACERDPDLKEWRGWLQVQCLAARRRSPNSDLSVINQYQPNPR